MVTFEESGMVFSFEDADIFRIEKSERFNTISGAKPCECVVYHNNQVVLIEAKSSSPRLEGDGSGNERLVKFVGEIAEKFHDSLTYYHAAHQKRQQPDMLPANLQSVALDRHDYVFCLIINGHEKSWCVPVQEKLKVTMKKMLKLWGLNDACVKVMNEGTALSKGLINATV